MAETTPRAPRTDVPPDTGGNNRLRGSLGMWAIVFIVLAAASPLGVMGGTVPIGIDYGNGAAFPAIFLACTIILLLFSVGFTTLTPYVKNAGAFYSYIGKGLGRRIGFGAAFMALLAYMCEVIAVYGLLGGGAQSLFSSWNIDIHWAVWAVLAIVGVAILGHRNIDVSKWVLGVLMIAEVLIVLVLDAVVFANGGPEGPSTAWLQPELIVSGAPGLALLFAFLSFLGFEATAVFRDEARDPEKTVPRATYTAVIFIGLFYVISTWALITAFGDSAAEEFAAENPVGMLPQATATYLGTVAEHIIQVLFVTSLFACVLSFHNIVSRYGFTIANRGALPQKFAVPHSRHGSPHTASAVVSIIAVVFIIAAALIGLDGDTVYAWFAGTTTIGFVVLLAGTTLAVLVFFARERRAGTAGLSVWRTVVAPGIALASLVLVVFLALSNLPGLIDGKVSSALVIIGVIAAAFIGGFVLAARRKHLEL
ncbi:APC family permease [Microbacterium sp.]|uniref:APC family permease n=1 Tax=Microbacterium sp. TaxID=51671 RepID=UPI003A89F60F